MTDRRYHSRIQNQKGWKSAVCCLTRDEEEVDGQGVLTLWARRSSILRRSKFSSPGGAPSILSFCSWSSWSSCDGCWCRIKKSAKLLIHLRLSRPVPPVFFVAPLLLLCVDSSPLIEDQGRLGEVTSMTAFNPCNLPASVASASMAEILLPCSCSTSLRGSV